MQDNPKKELSLDNLLGPDQDLRSFLLSYLQHGRAPMDRAQLVIEANG